MSEQELEDLLSVVIEDTTIESERLRQYIKGLRNELNTLKEIEQLHQEENGKLRVELEKQKETNKAFHHFIVFNGGKDIEDVTATKYMEIRREGYIEGRQDAQQEIKKIQKELEQEKEKNKDLQKQLNGAFDRGFISKDKIKKIVNECLEKKPNVITGKEEYCFNTNDNSFLAHKIVEILEKK